MGTCETCGKNITDKWKFAHPKRVRRFCSMRCRWGKGRPEMKSEKHWQWKGDFASKSAKHKWLYKNVGKARFCLVCGKIATKRAFAWANIDHKYKRDINDYIPLCPLHHKAWDYQKMPLNLGEMWSNYRNLYL